jgi:peptide/nickel transport system permease protein
VGGRFARNRLSVIGLGAILAVVAVAALGPALAPFPEDATGHIDMARRLQPPSRAHPFGTDEMGRDVFSRVVIGSRVSLGVGFLVLTMAVGIGVTLGAIAGFLAGAAGELIMRVTDIFLTIPSLILALAISAALGPSIANVILALSLVWWPAYCRLVQGEVLSRKSETYVAAATGVGAGWPRVLFRHVLPNCLSPVLVKASLDMGFIILTAAGLGFIGIGARPPTPEWGQMISTGRHFMPAWWWYPVFPGLAIFVTAMGFNLLGDGLRDLFDPRTRRG